ncbi:TBC1 domain family member 30, partial [Biomphalaria glabrata]
DLHRTGCSNFSGDDNGEDRAVLKRLLLAYARWNKRVGYCQGFNVLAALLLNVMDRKEDDALK